MIERVFDLIGIAVVLMLGVVGFGLAWIVARSRTTPEGVGRPIEAAILAVMGALMARIFISLLLGAGNDSEGAGLAIGWGFFLIPGVIDTVSTLASNGPILTTPDALMLLATIVGGSVGMMGGMWKIYDWTGLGWLAFPLDVTWALAGNSVGCLLHVINFAWGEHSDEIRKDAHRYAKGFGLRYNPRFAFTQGAVMSNLDEGHGTPLYNHERTHVWQNRAFGPIYTLTYMGWMLIWLIPSIVAGIAVKGISGLWGGPNAWCYFNNPWEAWAYKVQNADRTTISGVDEDDKKLIWPGKYVIAWAVPFFLVATFLVAFATVQIFMNDDPAVAGKARGLQPGQGLSPPPAGQPSGAPGHSGAR